MKIIKPLSLGLLYKTYRQSGVNRLVVTALGFFPLGEASPQRFLMEGPQWARALAALPPGQALDEAMPKAGAEALVLGRACAPGNRPVTRMEARLQVGPIDKRLAVFGDRQWRYGVLPLFGISQPAEFVHMPLDFAHAFGGPGCEANPVGCGYDGNRLAAMAGANEGAMPNIEYAVQPVDCHGRHYPPAGLGPMPIDWMPRKRYAGTYDERWLREDYPGLPRDLDWRLYNQAATDQRIANSFVGGEAYLLQGMHPQIETIRGVLPEQRVKAFALKRDASPASLAEIGLRMDTVWFLPEQQLGIAAWRGEIQITDSDALDIGVLMLAYEGATEAPRTLSYYAEVLTLRLDPKTAPLHALNESQLAPSLDPIDPALAVAEAEAALKKRQDVLDEVTREFWQQSGMTPPVGYEPPKVGPPLLQTPSAKALADGDMDLTDLMHSVEKLVASTRENAAAQQAAFTHQLAELQVLTGQAGQTDAPAGEGKTVPEPGPPWTEVLQRADGSATQEALAPLALAATPSQHADLMAAAQLKNKARHASPIPLSPAQALSRAVASLLGAQVLAWAKAGENLAGRDLAGADLRGAVLAGLDLGGCMLEYADLSGADLRGCNLRRAVLTQARLNGALLDEANLDEANLCSSDARGASFRGASLCSVRASRANWMQADGHGCDLSAAQLDDADLCGASFDDAKLNTTILNQAKLAGSSWCGASFNKCVAWKLQAQGADFSGSQWQRSALIGSDLSASKWREARLVQVQGNDSDWRGADLSGLRAERGSWTQSQLQGARLDGAFIMACDMSRADLSAASLDGACLPRTLMMKAQLPGVSAVGADFYQALLRKADFGKADLREASLYEAELTEVCLVDADTRGVRLDARRRLA
ncbi:DUF2169 family type VI secretion system accessory protein [Polaromonas aquatica]|uniref:DUF2169 family type VI secretion system accessory protein n=1 Tax=Polaromonas aquatica TaxID=332657 RepID=UPI003D6596BB